MRTDYCYDDASLAYALKMLAIEIRYALEAGGKVIGYRLRDFDIPHVDYHAMRLGVDFPKLDRRPFNNGQVIDLYDWFDDKTEHVISRSLKSVCAVLGLGIPDDDGCGADIAALWEARDDAGIKLHGRRDVERTLALAERLSVLPKTHVVFDLETRADERMVAHLGDVRLGNVKDPDKVAKALAEKRAAQLEKMSLDPMASVPVLVAYHSTSQFHVSDEDMRLQSLLFEASVATFASEAR